MSAAHADIEVAVFVVNWNTCELLACCLEALQAQSLARSVCVYVVDNASDDGSANMVLSRFPEVRLFALSENIGFVGGNNFAFAQAAEARYILLLNPDAILRPGALATMTAWMDANPAAGACGPLTVNPDGTLQLSWSRFPSLRRELWGGHDRRFFGHARASELSRDALRALPAPVRVDWVSGACLLVRRDCVMYDLKGMLLDPAFHMYSEETDLCLRLAKAGRATYFVPQAEVEHHYGQSSRQAQARTLCLLFRSKYVFFRKHYGRGQAMLLQGMVALTGSLKWTVFTVLRRPEQSARQRAILQSLRRDCERL